MAPSPAKHIGRISEPISHCFRLSLFLVLAIS
jgi:hypothetical protein